MRDPQRRASKTKHRLVEADPAGLGVRPGDRSWRERSRALPWHLCRRQVPVFYNLLPLGQRSLLPWDAVLLGFGPSVPPDSLLLAQDLADLR